MLPSATSFVLGGSRASALPLLTSVLALCATLGHAVPANNNPRQYNTAALVRQDNATTLGDCLAAAGVETSLSSSATFSTDSEAWNSRLSPVPSAVVFPKTEEEVTAALQCATQTGTKVTTLGGNRSFSSMGFGRDDGAMVINLKNMKTMEYDEATEVLTYGGPVMISELAGYLWSNFTRTLPHGRCPDVGMTGVAASGFGTLSRLAGTVLDNIVGARVALANGTIVDANANQNADLYWALRGAASSLGVVLSFKIQTIAPPSERVTNYTIAFPTGYTPTQQENVDALLGSQAWAQSADNSDLVSIRYSLGASSKLAGFFYGTQAEFAAVAESLLSYLPSNMNVTSNEYDFWGSEDIATPGIAAQTLTPRRYFYVASVTIPGSAPLDNSTAWQLYSSTVYAGKLPDASSSGFVDIWGGAYTQSVAADASAWKHDDNLLLVRWDIRSSSFDVAFAEESLTTMRTRFYEFVDGYRAAGGAPGGFTTYRDDRWTIEETAEYLYGANWDRLQEVKTTYDPAELFNTDPQAVPALLVAA